MSTDPTLHEFGTRARNRTLGIVLGLVIAAVLGFSVWYIIWFKNHS